MEDSRPRLPTEVVSCIKSGYIEGTITPMHINTLMIMYCCAVMEDIANLYSLKTHGFCHLTLNMFRLSIEYSLTPLRTKQFDPYLICVPDIAGEFTGQFEPRHRSFGSKIKRAGILH